MRSSKRLEGLNFHLRIPVQMRKARPSEPAIATMMTIVFLAIVAACDVLAALADGSEAAVALAATPDTMTVWVTGPFAAAGVVFEAGVEGAAAAEVGEALEGAADVGEEATLVVEGTVVLGEDAADVSDMRLVVVATDVVVPEARRLVRLPSRPPLALVVVPAGKDVVGTEATEVVVPGAEADVCDAASAPAEVVPLVDPSTPMGTAGAALAKASESAGMRFLIIRLCSLAWPAYGSWRAAAGVGTKARVRRREVAKKTSVRERDLDVGVMAGGWFG